MGFEERVAVVTGSARGIGKAIASRLLTAGNAVVVVDLDENAVQESCREIAEAAGNNAGDRILGLACNVADPDSVQALFKSVKEKFGRLDILVNNAGITRDNLFMRMTFEQWKDVIDVNLTGTFLCCRHAVSMLRKSPAGRIVNLASIARDGNPGQANYASSKAGVVALTKTLATELARYNVTVNAVAPGVIDTEMTRAVPEKMRAQWTDKIPAGRPGTVDDIAEAVVFFASETASYITGDVLRVDGGMRI